MSLVAALLLLAHAALADEPRAPRWRWQISEPARFETIMTLDTPRGYTCFSPGGASAVFLRQRWALQAACAPSPEKRGFTLSCTASEVQIEGDAERAKGDQAGLALAGLQAALQGQSFRVIQRSSGAVVGLELDQGLREAARTADVQEILRQMLRRLFSPLDLPLPEAGREVWRQRGLPLLFNVVGAAYGLEGMRLRHGVNGWEGDTVEISTAGDATVAGMDVRAIGRGHFDDARGLLLDRWVLSDTQLSAEGAGLGDPTWQELRVDLRLLEAFSPTGP